MNRIVLFLLAALALSRCGESVESVVIESIIVDEVITLDPEAFISYPFSVDFSVMDSPLIFAGFSSDDGTTLVSILVLTEGNFEFWERGESYSAIVESPLLATTAFESYILTNGSYRVVISNRSDALDDKRVGVFASLQWQPVD